MAGGDTATQNGLKSGSITVGPSFLRSRKPSLPVSRKSPTFVYSVLIRSFQAMCICSLRTRNKTPVVRPNIKTP